MSEPKFAVRAGNAMMRGRILHMAPQPYVDGKPAYRVVIIAGRQSGQPRQVPLAVFPHAGQRYLIAPTRQRDWVHNLIAAQHCTLLSRDTTEECSASMVDDVAAVAAMRSYRVYIGDGMSSEQFPFGSQASLTEIQAHLPTMAVFRLSTPPTGAPAGSDVS